MAGISTRRFLGILTVLALLIPTVSYALPGDLDNSGRVDGYDLVLFARAMGATESDAHWLADADLDGNGTVDQADLAILSAHFGRTGAAFGVWVYNYASQHTAVRFGEEAQLLATSPKLTAGIKQFAGNPRDGTVWALTTDNTIFLLSPTNDAILKTITNTHANAIAFNPDDQSLWACDTTNDRIIRFSPSIPASYDLDTDTGHHRTFTGLSNPIALDVDGRTNTVWVIDGTVLIRLRGDAPDGYDLASNTGYHRRITTTFSPKLIRVNQGDSSAWLAASSQLQRLDPTGRTVLVDLNIFSNIVDIAPNPMDGSIAVADAGSQRKIIRRIGPDGAVFFESASLSDVQGVAVNPLDASMWVTNPSADIIIHLAANGTKLSESAKLSSLGAPITLIPAGGDAARFPTALALADRTNIDVGQPVNFTGIGTDNDGTIIRYRWDFEGDGTFDATATDSGDISHTYSATGIYTPIFEVMDNDHLTAVDHRLVIRVGKLTATASADVTTGEAPLTVNFDGSFTDPLNGRVDSFQWDFDGDGIFDYYSDSSPKVSHSYTRQGTYTAIFKVTDGPHSATDSLIITVSKSAPTVRANANPSSGLLPLTVNFSAVAQDADGTVVLYQWDFEDDGTVDWTSVSSANATHVYSTPGTYTARVTVTDNDGQQSSATIDITVDAPPPVANATATPDKGTIPLTVHFSAAGSTATVGTISKYEWDFGDCQILFRDDAENGITNWQADAPWGITDQSWRSSNHAFTDSPAGAYATDADVSLTLKNPLDLSAITSATLSFWHRYSLGSYTTLLAQVSTNGGNTWNTLKSFTSSSSQPTWTKISLDLSSYLPADQLLIRFRLSPGYYAQAEDGWYIDDIQVASCAESWTASADGAASHVYQTAGEFTARLRITDSAGEQDITTVPIQAFPTNVPFVTLNATPARGLAPLAVALTPTVTASSTVAEYAWNFGEDILWTATTSKISRRWALTGRELAAASSSYLSVMTVDPVDGSLWVGDSNADVIVHLSPNGKELTKWRLSNPRAIVADDSSLWILQTDTLRRFRKSGELLTTISGFNAYTASMASDPTSGVLWILETSQKRVTRLNTTAPDGYNISTAKGHHLTITGFSYPRAIAVASDHSVWVADSSAQEVIHIAQDGTVLAKVTGLSDLRDIVTAQNKVWIATPTQIVILDSTVADGYDISTDTGSHATLSGYANINQLVVDATTDTVWVLDTNGQRIVHLAADGSTARTIPLPDQQTFFLAVLSRGSSNETTSTTADPVNHTFTTPGINPVRLIITDANGRKAVADLDVIVATAPTVSLQALPTTGAAPLTVTFIPTITDRDNGRAAHLAWDFDNDGTTDLATTSANPVQHTYNAAGTYTAKLQVTDDDGNTTIATAQVTVSQASPKVMLTASPPRGYAPLTVQLKATSSDPDGTVTAIAWDLDGDGATDATTATTTHTFTTAGTKTVTVTVTDNDGNSTQQNLTVEVLATDAPWPVLQLFPTTQGRTNEPIAFCAGGTDPNDAITGADLDFDGDGAFDQSANAPFTALADDFELANGGWTAEAPWTRSAESAFSGGFAYTDSEGGNYANSVDASLISPSIDLSSTVAPRLRFRQKYTFLYGDTGYVDISTDNGSTWTQLASYSNSSKDWHAIEIDLRRYAGQATVKIRFRFTSNASDTADGWHIDDVFVGDCVEFIPTSAGMWTPVLRLTDAAGNQASRTATLRIDHPEAASRIWVADTYRHLVHEYRDDGTELRRFGGFSYPRMVTQDPKTGTIWVADTGKDRIVRFDASAQTGFQAGSAAVADSSPSKAGGFLAGDAAYTATGKLNGGVQFDGNGDYVQIADHRAFHAPSFTIEAWVYPTAASGVDTIAGKVGQYKDFALVLNNGVPAALVYDRGRRYVQPTDPLPLNQWSHLAMTYDNATGQVILYVNGGQVAQANWRADTTNTDPFTIGRSYCCGDYFTGIIDEVRFWNTVRTQAEINGGKDAELTGNETGLIGYWRLNNDPGGITIISGFNDPYVIAIAADHSVWVTDYANHQVVHLAADGSQELARIDGFANPRGIIVAQDGTIWVADYGNQQIVQLDAAGTELQRLGGFSSPVTLREQTATGAIWLADYNASQVIRLGADGSEQLRHSGFYKIVGLDVAQASGEVWAADYYNHQVVLLDGDGNELLRLSGFNQPYHLAVDQQDGSVWVADSYNNRVVHVSRNGSVRHVITGLSRPLYVSVIQPTEQNTALNPPTATANVSPTAGSAPLAVTLTASATDDGSITEYAWDFDGDGTFDATGASQTHTYSQPGVYHVVLRVRDNDGLYGYDASQTVRITPFTIQATASPLTGVAPLKISFNGKLNSISANRRIVLWQWDFDNDGTVDFTNSNSPRTEHTFSATGVYHPLLIALDDQGNRAHARVTVTVNNAPPSASNKASPTSGDAPLLVKFVGDAWDPNGAIAFYRWDFNGDGIDDWISKERDTWFLYDTPGIYDTVFTAIDDEGAETRATRTVTVNTVHAPPTVTLTATPSKGQAPLTVNLTAAASDADGSIVAWSWDLDGDGAADTDTAGPHTQTFTQVGTYRVTVTVTDNDGQSATAKALITVQPANAPTARLQASPLSGSLPFDVVFNGADSTDNDGSIVSYRWSFGDTRIWISSSAQHAVYRYRNMTREAEYGGMYGPIRLARDTDGTVWVADRYHNQVVKLAADSSTELLRLDGFDDPIGLALNPNDRTLWVADYYHNQVVHLDRNGQELGRFDGFNRPIDLAVNPSDGSVWVVDHIGNRLIHLATDGTWLASIEGFYHPYQVIWRLESGELWVSDRDNDRVVRLPATVPDGFHASQSNAVVTEALTGKQASLFNEAASTPSGKIGGALTLDGNGDYVLLPASSSLDVQSFTIEAWIKPTVISGEPAIFMRGNANGGNEIFFGLYDASTISTALDNTSYSFRGSANFLDGNWHHVALVFDQTAGTLSCYVDGALYGTPQNITATLDFGDSRALIGADFDRFNSSIGNYFNGQIDEVRVWRTARSQAEIAATMNAPLSGSEVGLAAYWPLDTASKQDVLRITGLAYPAVMALDARHQRIWVCDDQLDAVIAFDTSSGREVNRIGGIKAPWAAAVDPASGAIWIGDNDTDTLRLFALDGTQLSSISGVSDPSDILLISSESQTATPTVRHTYTTPGTYLATLTVTDNSGLTDTDSVLIRAGIGPEAVPIAYPTTGPAPLTVRFVTNARGPEGTIESFAWDFDGDGTFEWYNAIPEVTTHTYGTPGVYHATLRVTDNKGRTDTKSVTITVSSPDSTLVADILAVPAGGTAPFTSQLTAFVRATTFIAKYEWDTDGDGAFDATGQTVTLTLTDPGSRTVRLRVTDQDGNAAEATTTVTAVAAGTPTASASATPNEGPASLEVTFSGSGVDSDGAIVEYAWDFDGDGTFDHTAATPADVTHVYHTPGTYNAVFRVTDNDGKTASVTVPVTVTAGITATLDRDQFDPSAGETITIASTLTGKATVTIRITDRNGNTLRTLVKDAVRSPGFYQDTWNGKDDAGKTVGTGVYLYLIDYTVDGITYHYDVTNSVDTAVRKITPQYPSSFNPFSAETNFFRYTLDTKSEVTIYMSPFVGGAQTRVKTLQLRSPRRAGSYVQTWDGTDDLGNLVKPMNYVIAVFAWQLPPNAIIVENRPVIGDLHVTPSTLNPAASPYDDVTQASILFSLSKDATVTAQILDEDNYRVTTVTVTGKAGTGNAIVWDGTNEAGELVAPGIYRVQITAEDSLGHRSQEANTVLIIFY